LSFVQHAKHCPSITKMFSTKKISAKGKAAPKPLKSAAKAAPKPVKKAVKKVASTVGKTTGGWLGSGSGDIALDKWYGERFLRPVAATRSMSLPTSKLRCYFNVWRDFLVSALLASFCTPRLYEI
jgi:hypothetical protein